MFFKSFLCDESFLWIWYMLRIHFCTITSMSWQCKIFFFLNFFYFILSAYCIIILVWGIICVHFYNIFIFYFHSEFTINVIIETNLLNKILTKPVYIVFKQTSFITYERLKAPRRQRQDKLRSWLFRTSFEPETSMKKHAVMDIHWWIQYWNNTVLTLLLRQ